MTHRKKLIEVALPLAEINAACKADKDRKTGTIRNIHKWFAPAPLPAWRALLFAALIDDPEDDEKRVYLLDLIKRLVANGADLPDEEVLEEAREIIRAQFPDGVPPVMDPFCGGGSTLVEAQRLGLPTYGSDLNPVPVLITRTLTELLPKVHGQQPLHPEPDDAPKRPGRRGAPVDDSLFTSSGKSRTYSGYDGLIRDITYYAERIRDQTWDQLKDYYPSQPGETPIAWLWARTATCPNPACGIETILTTSWWLSKKRGELAWIEPCVRNDRVELHLVSGQASGEAPPSPKFGDGVFACLACQATLDGKYLRQEGTESRMGVRLTAVSVEVEGQRHYRPPSDADIEASQPPVDRRVANVPINVSGQGIRVGLYGVSTWDQLFLPRQLLTLTTIADLIATTYEVILEDGGSAEWAKAIVSVLGLALGKQAQSGSCECRWMLRPTAHAKAVAAFDRVDLPMMWDFAETSFTSESVGDWLQNVKTALRALEFPVSSAHGRASRIDARSVLSERPALVATDPPYFDAIGYADLSDYFYVWHRRALRNVHPDIYGTVAAPKRGELTAIPGHHNGSKQDAREYFIDGFTDTFANLQRSLDAALPMLVVYASKEQSSGRGEETRWEAILASTIASGLEITGTWPIHMTSGTRMRGLGANAVAAYVVMVVRPRDAEAATVTLQDFNRALRRELPGAVQALQESSVLPIDLPQAVLGPGMQIFSRHQGVLDQAGEPIPVGRAMEMISEALAEVLDEQEGELDPDSRFAVAWWEEHHWAPGPFGQADQVARPQGISVDDVVTAGVATSRGGRVTLLGAGDLDRSWTPATDQRPTAWEAVHHLADRLIDGGGQLEAARLMAELGDLKYSAQTLVYRLESIAARKGWTKDQERYNTLIASWTDLLADTLDLNEATEGLF